MKEPNRVEDPQEKVNKTNLIKIAFHIWRQFDDPYYTGFAAQIAYFFFMASIPTLVVLSQFLGIFDISLDFVKEWMESHLDSQMSSFVVSLFSASSVRFTNVMMIIVALWSASSLEFSLARLDSHVLTHGTYRFHFFTERIKAIPTAVVSILSIAFSLVIYVYGEQLFSTLFRASLFTRFLIALRLPIVAGLFFLMILLNYYILPRIRVPLRAVLPGAIFAWVGITLVTMFYGFYIGYIAHYNIIYGTFANMVALMLWFYLISWVLCIGMMFNKAWDDVMKRDRLTLEKQKEYLRARMADSKEDYKRFFIREDDFLNDSLDTTAVKYSKRFVDGYEEELERERRTRHAQIKANRRALDLYDELMRDDDEEN